MVSLEARIIACADACANLLAQLNELVELHERVRNAQLALAKRKPAKQRPISGSRRRAPRQ